MKNDFVHLHVHSTYSLLDSVATIPKLVRRAKELGMPALALTDHGNMFGIKEFYDACVSTRGEQAIKPILGCEVFVTSSGDHTKRDKNEKRYHLCLYAKNKTGYQNLMRLVSLAHREGFYFRPRIDRALLEKYHEGLACTSACIAGEVASCLDRGETAKAEETAQWYKNLFGEDYYLEVMLHPAIRRHPDIPKDAESDHINMFQRQQRVMNGLLALGQKLDIPCLASNDVHFVNPEDIDAQDVWLALGTGNKMIDPYRLVYTGSEWLKTGDEMAELFPDHPELLANTLRFAERIETFALDDVPLMPEFPIPDSFGTLADYAKRFDEAALKDEFNSVRPIEYERLGGYEKVLKIKLQSDYLRQLTYAGAKMRWGDPIPKDVCNRLDFELDVIKRMGYPGYLLIVQDYVAEARRMGVAVGPGRGSAAGSAVVYALGITSVDPLEHDLLFERFLNPDRISCPDIDIDFDNGGTAESHRLRSREVRRGSRRSDHYVWHGVSACGNQGRKPCPRLSAQGREPTGRTRPEQTAHHLRAGALPVGGAAATLREWRAHRAEDPASCREAGGMRPSAGNACVRTDRLARSADGSHSAHGC